MGKGKEERRREERKGEADLISRHLPQNCPLTPTHLPLLQMVLVSVVFWRHWWQEVPIVWLYVLSPNRSQTLLSIALVTSSGISTPSLGSICPGLGARFFTLSS